MTLYLLRHGETDWNREPARCLGWAEVPLNETGRAQARAVGARLRTAVPAIDLIVTSHLTRARETAEIVREALAGGGDEVAASGGEAAAIGGDEVAASGAAGGEAQVDLVVDERLAETRRGEWESRLFSDIIAAEPEAWRAYREHPESFRFPGGESLAEQQRRVLEALRDAALTGRVALLVTHGGSIRLIRCFLEGRGIAAFHETTVPNAEALPVDDSGLAAKIDVHLGLGHDPGAGTRGPCEPHG